MKKLNSLVILLIFVLGSCATIKQKSSARNTSNPQYKALNSFSYDTLEYIKTNFYENQQFYVGKPVKVLLDDLEADIVNFTPNSLWNPMDKSNGVSLTIRHTKHIAIENNLSAAIPTYFDLILKFNELYVYMDALELWNRETEINWGKAQEDFYKDFTIKEIFLYVPEIEPIE
ncbi:hypothetical protein [Geofilum rubicundum]|uniref:Lipoprotein n=1 Tax=Geofilum rubicundum JCM 15548 TaxID=1236989 RepID=A0A0E9LS12_9BACT|nr:hypothetical protein [Geofilum rubicundum]GAO27926.1 hypothetical protein JCM15548_14805 [Geofilum rubicundum JCM 15548]